MPPCVVPWAARDLWHPLDNCLVTGPLPVFERMATAAITAALVTAAATRTASGSSTATTTGSVVTTLSAAHARVIRPARRCAALSLALTLAAGCLAEDATVPIVPPRRPPGSKVVQLVVEPATTSLLPGESQTFAAYGLASDGRHVDGPVVWSAAGGTITPDGVFTADTAVGSFPVTASSNAWGLAGTASVRVLSRRRVASVAVRPDTATLPIEGSWPFHAMLRDSAGDTLSGGTVTWTSSDPSVAVVDSTGLVTGVTPGTATITAVSEGQSGAGLITVVRPGTGPWPNEPAGFKVVADNPFNVLTGDGWSLIDNVTGLGTLGVDAQAPLSPPGVLQYFYPIGFSAGIGPAAERHDLPNLKQAFLGIWWKVSNPWEGHASNVNKVQILFPDEGGDIYMVMYGSPGGPYELRVIPQFLNMASNWLVPNVNHVPVMLGQWHRVEWLLIYNTTTNPPNGIIRWWLDGQLIGDYYNVQFPNSPMSVYKVSAIWGGVTGRKTENDYYWYDHVHISGR